MENGELFEKLNSTTAVIGIVGLGYVGIPQALRYAEVGYKVLGLDIDADKAKKISVGKTSIKHIFGEAIHKAVEQSFEASTNFSRAAEDCALGSSESGKKIAVPYLASRSRVDDMRDLPSLTILN